jgi:hypothetical protein
MIDIVKAALAYVILTFPLAYVWHLTVFKDRYAALQVYRATVLPQFGLASMLIQGVLFGVIYAGVVAPMAEGWLVKGLAYAALGGLLSWSFTTIAPSAKSPMTSIRDFFVIETAFTAIQWILVGLATALILS